MASAYPLAWPDGWTRTKHRNQGKLKTSLPGALKNVEKSIELFSHDSGKKVTNMVIVYGLFDAHGWHSAIS